MNKELHLFKELLRCAGINESVKNNSQFKEEVSLIEKALKRNKPMKVYIAGVSYEKHDYSVNEIVGVFDSEEKAKKAINTEIKEKSNIGIIDVQRLDEDYYFIDEREVK